MKKKKIVVITDFGSSGIAESIHPILLHWHKQGHKIWQMAVGYHGSLHAVDKKKYPWYHHLSPVFPAASPNDRFGQSSLGEVVRIFKPDFVLTAFDIWMVSYLAMPESDPILNDRDKELLSHSNRPFKHIAYFPIDAAREEKYLPPTLDELIAGFDIPITYSSFAQKLIYRDMHLHVPMVPIAHDPKIYCPGDKVAARKAIGLPQDRYIVGMIATNQYRKLFGQFFDAVTPLAHNHNDVLILPWTTWDLQIMGGHSIGDLVWRNDVAEQTINPPPNFVGKLKEKDMANLYRSLDVLILLTIGEGAGLPPLRARACGVPTFVSDNTSNTEFSTHEFELIPNSCKFYDSYGSNLTRYNSNVPELTKRLETLYASDKKDGALRQEMVAAGIEGMRKYEIANIMPMWDAVLEENS